MQQVVDTQNMVWKKRCYTCKRDLPLCEFSYNKSAHTKIKLQGSCKECSRSKKRKHYQENREAELERRKQYHQQHQDEERARHRLRKYGITARQYATLLEAQGGRCRICGQQGTEPWQLCVDHNHVTGAVRGLLCAGCNSGLGYFKDSSNLMRLAIAYLKETGTSECEQ